MSGHRRLPRRLQGRERIRSGCLGRQPDTSETGQGRPAQIEGDEQADFADGTLASILRDMRKLNPRLS